MTLLRNVGEAEVKDGQKRWEGGLKAFLRNKLCVTTTVPPPIDHVSSHKFLFWRHPIGCSLLEKSAFTKETSSFQILLSTCTLHRPGPTATPYYSPLMADQRASD